ncbi:hypothetical protein AGLY_012273 [Aphis glycines]|uniref:PiggyBac transposable element-derived protein domain-containing protein n=1 Tax=Aphis glycines TaxID=307491 RepID=A0A6G0TBR4_APHGL|nr:hypothetical protein AGLY_012273 [Aphis glycines]
MNSQNNPLRFEQLLNSLSVEYEEKIVVADGSMKKLDLSLLLHRWRIDFRHYIKGKKAKYGIKLYELCSPEGYVLNMEMYKRKQISRLRLMAPYLNKGHHLFMDNYYSSVNLSNLLLKHKTNTTGTLRSNRRGNQKFDLLFISAWEADEIFEDNDYNSAEALDCIIYYACGASPKN